MGNLTDLQTRIARALEACFPEHDAQRLAEDLELLADYRSIEDRSVRDIIRAMVADVATSFHRG